MSDEVSLIGDRIKYSKSTKTFLIDRRGVSYRIYEDEFVQMIYVALREGMIRFEIVGNNMDGLGAMRLKMPKDKIYEKWIADCDADKDN